MKQLSVVFAFFIASKINCGDGEPIGEPTQTVQLHPFDTSLKCPMFSFSGHENYTFLPTTKYWKGYPVYQGFDNDSCDGLNRYLYRDQGDEWFFDVYVNDSPHSDVEYAHFGERFDDCLGNTAVNFLNGGTAMLEKIDSSTCFTGTATAPPLAVPGPAGETLRIDRSHKCPVFSVSGHENYTIHPTTTIKNGHPVYQAFDNEKCVALNRYYYRLAVQEMKSEFGDKWTLDTDLQESTVYGHLFSLFKECLNDANLVTRNMEGEAAWSTLKKIESSTCSIDAVAPAKQTLIIDTSLKCPMFSFSGHENYTFLPTTTYKNGHSVYQGFDNDSCDGLNRYIYRSSLSEVNGEGYEWSFDHDLKEAQHAANAYGSISARFGDCVKEATLVAHKSDGEEITSHLNEIKSSKCFPTKPTKPAKLPIDTSLKCPMFSLSGHENYTFLPTTTYKHGYPVYQGFDNDTCDGLNRYMYRSSSAQNSVEWRFAYDLGEEDERGGFLNRFKYCVSGGVSLYEWYGKYTDSQLEEIQRSTCFPHTTVFTTPPVGVPTPTEQLPLDLNLTCPMFSFVGDENYMFLPTTKMMNGYPVYQGYDNDTCAALNRYMYSSSLKPDSWVFDLDLVESDKIQDRYGYVFGTWKGCLIEANVSFLQDGGNLGRTNLEKLDYSPCHPPLVTNKIPVDTSLKCPMFSFSGHENYTFLPTTTYKNGYPVYQGFDNDSCDGLNRYIYRSSSSHHGGNSYEWLLDSDLQESDFSVRQYGYVFGRFRKCLGNATVAWNNRPTGLMVYSKLREIESSGCF